LHHFLEIPNYLSSEECDDIVRLAQEQGLETSQTLDEDLYEDPEGFQDDQSDVFEYYDYNKDNFLDVDEVSPMYLEVKCYAYSLFCCYTVLYRFAQMIR
jgi:hypothetical protein